MLSNCCWISGPIWRRSKRVVVFAHDVPYELDATDISKLDTYYALYGASPSFVSLAARLLFPGSAHRPAICR